MITRWKLNCGRAATMLCVAACTQVSRSRCARRSGGHRHQARRDGCAEDCGIGLRGQRRRSLAEARDDFRSLRRQRARPAIPEPGSRRFRIHHPRHQRQRTVRSRRVPRRVRDHCERPAGRRRQECADPAGRCRAHRSAQRPARNPVRVELDGGQHPLHHEQAGRLEVRCQRRGRLQLDRGRRRWLRALRHGQCAAVARQTRDPLRRLSRGPRRLDRSSPPRTRRGVQWRQRGHQHDRDHRRRA